MSRKADGISSNAYTISIVKVGGIPGGKRIASVPRVQGLWHGVTLECGLQVGTLSMFRQSTFRKAR